MRFTNYGYMVLFIFYIKIMFSVNNALNYENCVELINYEFRHKPQKVLYFIGCLNMCLKSSKEKNMYLYDF